MHGFGHYSARSPAPFLKPETLYTFSIWAQNDIDSTGNESNGVFMYIFDGSVAFQRRQFALATHLFTAGQAFANARCRNDGGPESSQLD